MPQMAPISWLTLFFIFSLSLILFNMMNYFSYITLSPKSNNKKNNNYNSLNWKW